MKTYWYNNTWILTFLLIPFFKPIGPCYYYVFDYIFQLWKAIAIVVILGLMLVNTNLKLYFSSIKKCISSKTIFFSSIKKYFSSSKCGYVGLLLFWFIYIMNCLRYGTDSRDSINNALTSIVLICFIGFCSKHDSNKLLKVLYNIFVVYCLAQLISIIIVRIFGIIIFEPFADNFTYFLGTDNYSAFSLLPMLGVILFYSMTCKRKIGVIEWACMISVCIENILTWSVTAMIAMIFAVVLLILYRYHAKILKFFSPRNFLAFLSVLLILIVVFHIQNFLSFIFVKMLHKDITLNSRTIIWDDALKLIKEKFVLGWGNLSNQQISSYVLYGASHAHNMLLELLLRTGIIGSIGYLAFLTSSLQKEWGKYSNTSAYVLEILFLSQIILFFADFYVTIMYFYCFMAIIYNQRYFHSSIASSVVTDKTNFNN